MTKNTRGAAERAFTLIEVLVVMAVLAVIGAAGFGVVTWRPTARREAESAMSWLYGILARSDRSGVSFDLKVEAGAQNGGLVAVWGRKSLGSDRWDAGEGCALRRVFSGSGTNLIHYSPQWGTFTPALTVKMTGGGGDVCYLVISGQGRLRVSDFQPVD